MTAKKVTGERIAAAILDNIFLSIVSLIPTGLFLLLMGFDDFLMIFINNSNPTETSPEYNMFVVGSAVLGLVLGVLYFGVVPAWKNGQTFGKMILKIKAIDEFGDNPTFMKHLVRAIQNWSTYVMGLFVWTVYINVLLFSAISFLTIIVSILVFIAFIMMISREDGRGLHDLLAGTRVVRCDEDLNEEFTIKTAQMSDWAEVADPDDDGFGTIKEIDEEKDSWDL